MAEGRDPTPTTSTHEAGDAAAEETASEAEMTSCSLCKKHIGLSLKSHLMDNCTGECPFGCEGTGEGGLIGAHLNDQNYKEAHFSALLRGVQEINELQVQESPKDVIDPEKAAIEKKFLAELDELDSRSQALSSKLIRTVSQLSTAQIDTLIQNAEMAKCNKEKLDNVKEKIKQLAQKLQLLNSYDATFRHMDAMTNRLLDKAVDLTTEATNIGSETSTAISETSEELEELRCLPTDRQLIWKVNHSRAKLLAHSYQDQKIHYSQPFWDGVFGFKLRLVLSTVNEDCKPVEAINCGLQLLKGNYDSINHWPFNRQVTIRLLNQNRGGRDISKTLYPEIKDWTRVIDEPKTYMIDQFTTKTVVLDPENGFVKDDLLFVEATVSDPVDEAASTSAASPDEGFQTGPTSGAGYGPGLSLRQGLVGGSGPGPSA